MPQLRLNYQVQHVCAKIARIFCLGEEKFKSFLGERFDSIAHRFLFIVGSYFLAFFREGFLPCVRSDSISVRPMRQVSPRLTYWLVRVFSVEVGL